MHEFHFKVSKVNIYVLRNASVLKSHLVKGILAGNIPGIYE